MKVDIDLYPEEGENKVDVKIEPKDLWNLDFTLALIIHPALEALKRDKHGSPPVDCEDVPEHLKFPEDEGDEFESYHLRTQSPKWHQRWEYVLDEMIFAFDMQSREHSWYQEENFEANKRILNGMRLFGKYYQMLWS